MKTLKSNKKLILSGFMALTVVTGAFAAEEKAGEKAPETKKEVTTNEFYGISYGLKNIDGITFDKQRNAALSPVQWAKKPLKTDASTTRYASLDKLQFFDFTKRDDTTYDIVTVNKKTDRSTITTFENQKPTSHTIIEPSGSYTATPDFCTILKEQTDSKSFREMAKTARVCRDFYARPGLDESTREKIEKHLQAHARNISLLKDSVAKEQVEANEKAGKDQTKHWYSFFTKSIFSGKPKDPQPRAVLSKTPSANETDDRTTIANLAEACGRLWDDAATDTAAAAPPAGAPAKSGATKK